MKKLKLGVNVFEDYYYPCIFFLDPKEIYQICENNEEKLIKIITNEDNESLKKFLNDVLFIYYGDPDYDVEIEWVRPNIEVEIKQFEHDSYGDRCSSESLTLNVYEN